MFSEEPVVEEQKLVSELPENRFAGDGSREGRSLDWLYATNDEDMLAGRSFSERRFPGRTVLEDCTLIVTPSRWFEEMPGQKM